MCDDGRTDGFESVSGLSSAAVRSTEVSWPDKRVGALRIIEPRPAQSRKSLGRMHQTLMAPANVAFHARNLGGRRTCVATSRKFLRVDFAQNQPSAMRQALSLFVAAHFNFVKQPRPRVGPPAFGSGQRDAEHFGGLFSLQSDKIAEFDQFGLLRFDRGETIQCVV